MKDLQQIKAMTAALKSLKAAVEKREKLSAKRSAMSTNNSTDKARGKVNADLNWQCMEVDKKATDFARLFEGSCCDVGTETKHYSPSGFHEYQY